MAPGNTWQQAARGWVIDADVQRTKGKRREARITSILFTLANVSQIVVMFLLASLGAAGIDTNKCWGENQDKGGVAYLKAIFQFGSVALLLSAAFCTWLFPYHGDALKELEDRQRDFYVQNPDGSGNIVDPDDLTSSIVVVGGGGMNKIVPVDT